MSAPSFSSFPPSFGSFPDLDSRPSQPEKSGQSQKDDKSKKAKRDKEGEKVKKQKRNHPRDWALGFEPSAPQSTLQNRPLDDEQLKAEEDRKRRDGDGGEGSIHAGRAESPLLFYSDRKGDPLNLRYGGLYAGDIPKYRLVGRELILGLLRDV